MKQETIDTFHRTFDFGWSQFFVWPFFAHTDNFHMLKVRKPYEPICNEIKAIIESFSKLASCFYVFLVSIVNCLARHEWSVIFWSAIFWSLIAIAIFSRDQDSDRRSSFGQKIEGRGLVWLFVALFLLSKSKLDRG